MALVPFILEHCTKHEGAPTKVHVIKDDANTLGNLNVYSEFKFKNGGKRYDVIEKTDLKIVYRQLTDYSNRVFEAGGNKLKMKIIELL